MSDIWTELLDAHEMARRPDRGVVPQHKPTAAVLSCSDARVPPSVVFGQAHGDLFIVRNAGNNAIPAAIAAAAANVTAPHLAPIVDPIRELCVNHSCADAGRVEGVAALCELASDSLRQLQDPFIAQEAQ